MTVKELIEQLQKMSPDKKVLLEKLDRNGKPEPQVLTVSRTEETKKTCVISGY